MASSMTEATTRPTTEGTTEVEKTEARNEQIKPEEQFVQKKIMVIAAHPDDPEFGCAATLAKWASAGHEITYLLLTSGDKGSRERKTPPGELAAVREVEQRAAAAELGVRKVIFLRHPDGLLENSLTLRRELSGHLREHGPDTLVTIDPWRKYQLHPDHRVAGQVALDAIYAAREWHIFPEQLIGDRIPCRVKDVYLFWTDSPDYYEDVTSSIDRRIEALKRHVSQVGERLEQLPERVREGARNVGKDAGLEYAEAFKHFKLG
jgi:LmbE family N-acetylglucosaminyl deacetylase